MEEFWDNSGPYALAKLADRLVPIPRDNEAQVSLYALCRAWVRNHPALPLVAEAPSPQQPYPRDSAARQGEGEGPSSNGDALQSGPPVQPQAAAASEAATTAAAAPSVPARAQQQQQLLDPQQTPAAAPPPPPPPSTQAAGSHDPQHNGLLSILPPVLPPTALETGTVPPMYPLDDFEVGELEEALRKFKDHWVAVRQYHQALRAAKLSRHRERLLVLLGEPSLLQPPPAAAMLGQPLQQQVAALQQMQMAAGPGVGVGAPAGMLVAPHPLQQMQQMQMLGSDQMAAAAAAANGVPGLAVFPGPVPGQGLLPGVAGFAMPQQAGAPGGAAVVSAADAQAALATIMNLGPAGAAEPAAVAAQRQAAGGGEGEGGIPGAAQLLQLGQQQQQQQLFLQLQQHQGQQQQQLGLLAGGPAGPGPAGQTALAPPLDVLQALQLGQPLLPQPAGVEAAVQPPVLRQIAAVAEAAEPAQGQQQQQPAQEQQGQGHEQQKPADAAGGAAGNGAASASVEAPDPPVEVVAVQPPALEKDDQGPASGSGPDGMDIDSGPPPGS